MDPVRQRLAAKQFVADWTGRGDEKQDAQNFWRQLLQQVYDVENPENEVLFEHGVKNDQTNTTIFIDAYITGTKVLIEQKRKDIDLRKGYRQSDGSMLTPYQQARRYAGLLPHDMNPRWIVVCNFREFHIHNMNQPNAEPEVVLLADLEKEYNRMQFLTDTGSENLKKEMEISIKAGEIVGLLYDALYRQYRDPESPRAQHSLNALCVRLVFCFYAEDADIFGRHLMFHDYMQRRGVAGARQALIDLFRVLDQPADVRDPYLDDDLASFPYVNGGLFSDEDIEIPRVTEEIYNLILRKASEDFDWSEISPTIFGAVFESTLNPETRRKGGMHYTSIENIHKVIDPLFLDELRAALDAALAEPVERERTRLLRSFQTKLAGLAFLDPAAGSGNFLTETYLSLRRLENRALTALTGGQIAFADLESQARVMVSIDQFYGIEINDFAVTVAKTALWIAESQMLRETASILRRDMDFLPLKTNAHIVEGNALRMDWTAVVPREKLSYIMGNPPFVGYSLQSKAQKEDILSLYVDEKGKPYKTAGKIDYVSGWYWKASELMQGTAIRTALVSTNSITQGEQVAGVWKPLYERFGIHIDFAHRTFRWDSAASIMAHVHCVIVGFSTAENPAEKRIYDDIVKPAQNINPFLVDAPNVFIESRSNPICDIPKMTTGNRPADGGHLIIEKDDYVPFIEKEPSAQKYIKKFVGSVEYINNKDRYCLWLVGVNPSDLRKMPEVMKRIELCRQDRLNSPDAGRQKLAETPTMFRETQNPEQYIIIPKVSSEKRKYIPCGFMDESVIPSDLVFIIPDATLYHFGVLTSNVHMAWMRAVCGRLKSDYRYSKDIVYNNFPWPSPTPEQRDRIAQTAQAILDARARYPDASLADLYDELTMPPELRRAHQENDRAVMRAYGFDVKTMTESACVAALMKLYQTMTEAQTPG